MRRQPATPVSMAIGVVTLLACITASAAPLTRETVEKSNHEIEASLKEQSAQKVRAWFNQRAAPDYAQVEADGTRTSRKECLDGALQMAQRQFKSIKWEIKSFKSGPRDAHSVENWSFEFTQRGPDGEDHQIVLSDTEDNLWVPTKSGWRVKSVKVLSSKTTLDGKPINAPQRDDSSTT